MDVQIAKNAQWKTPEEVKKAHPKASVPKGSRVVFNIKANDYRLIVLAHYESGIVMIRFFGTSVPGKSGKAHCPA